MTRVDEPGPRNPRKFGQRVVTVAVALLSATTGLAGGELHGGRIPFRFLERPPSPWVLSLSTRRADWSRLQVVAAHSRVTGAVPRDVVASLQPGDVVAFHMSHREAWKHLSRGRIQKIPYELFRFGHLALVVENPARPAGSGDRRLLQVAMRQAVDAGEGLAALDGRSWIAFRPGGGEVDRGRLHEFARIAVERASDRRKAYDYSGALGVVNAPWRPEKPGGIGDEFTCATLVVAALHYSGFELAAVHRGGLVDIVTPRQVVDSRGRWRE